MTYLGSDYYNVASANPNSWLDFVAPEYAECVAQWVYARDHYTGDCVAPWRVPSYLIRKKIGEATEAYEERVLLADYTPHFGSVVDTFAGMIGQVEGDADRKFGALGDEDDPTTLAGRLWMDADGERNSWLTLWQLVATDLVSVHDAWLLVEGGPDGLVPHVHIVKAEDVTNWLFENGVLVRALVKTCVDMRQTLQDNPGKSVEEQYIEYRTDGWTRWRRQRDDANRTETVVVATNPDGTEASGEYAYYDRAGRPTIPLVRIRLPLRRNVGYLMARKANAIFNKESERDHLLRFACFPILNVVGNDSQFKKIQALLRDGARVLQVIPGTVGGNHNFAAPETGPAEVLNATIAAKVLEYYNTAFREFGSAAARSARDRVTAAEIKQDLATGVAAFLGLVRSALDNAENTVMHLLVQTVYPATVVASNRAKWDDVSVTRSNDYAPFDMDKAMERFRTQYFGPTATIPVGRAGRVAAAMEIAQYDGLAATEADVGADVDAADMLNAAALITTLWPAMPDTVKSELIARYAASYGMDPAQVRTDSVAALAAATQAAAKQAEAAAKPKQVQVNAPPAKGA